MSPKVSVIMSVYNGAHFVRRSIESILAQSFSDFEFIIINDGSSDESEKIILEFKDERIRYIDNKVNLGLIASLNKGLSLAKGEYIARMDDDDISLPSRFEKQVAYLDEHKTTAVLATRLVIINENGFEVDNWKEDLLARSTDEIKQLLPKSNCIGHPTVMMRAECLRAFNYSSKLKNSEDWGLWLNLLSKGFVIAKLDEVLLQYRVHNKSTTVSANKNGIEKKVIRFKQAYMLGKIGARSFQNTDWKVLSSWMRDVLKLIVKPVLSPLIAILKTPFFSIFLQFFKVKNRLRSFHFKADQIYVFPYYQTGGADKVHASILEAVNNKNSIVFITGQSEDDAFKETFNRFSNVVEVNYLMKLSFFRKWLINEIGTHASNKRPLTIMGCNSYFFYEMIPSLPHHIKFVDLIHAFVHLHEPGPEKWSLPVIDRLHARVVIDKNTLANFDYFYRARNIDPKYVSRIIFIPNFVDARPLPSKSNNEILKVLYVGRGSTEKRLPIIAKVAHVIKLKKLPIEFHFAGNVTQFIPEQYAGACILHGTIDQKKVDELYKEAHMLIIASSREGFPMVIMEAMMQGVVPVSTGVGGIPDHISHKKNGILINEGNDDDIVAQFVEQIIYYNSNRVELELLSLNTHNYAIRTFNKEQFFNSYQILLQP
ncbi:MAG: glycosyltransferase [Bacteroidota bacterium]